MTITVFARKDFFEIDGEKVWGNWSPTLDGACDPFGAKTYFAKDSLVGPVADVGKCALGHPVVKAEHY